MAVTIILATAVTPVLITNSRCICSTSIAMPLAAAAAAAAAKRDFLGSALNKIKISQLQIFKIQNKSARIF